MHRIVILVLLSAGIVVAAPTFAASPSQQMSRYERDVHEAQKRLHKHRMQKAKELHKRRIRKAKRLIREQRRQQQRAVR